MSGAALIREVPRNEGLAEYQGPLDVKLQRFSLLGKEPILHFPEIVLVILWPWAQSRL